MAPQDVAAAGYEGLMKGELFVVPGGMNKALAAGRRILSEGAQARLKMKYYEDVPLEDQKRERGTLRRRPLGSIDSAAPGAFGRRLPGLLSEQGNRWPGAGGSSPLR